MTQGPPTIASEAIRVGAPGLASSFRFHRRRGPICGRGYCCQCEVATANGRSLACQTPAALEEPHGPDRLRLAGRIAERFPPWFYERRFLRPRVLGRGSLHALRYLSGAAALSGVPAAGVTRRYRQTEVELVVIGRVDGYADALRVDLATGSLAVGVYPDRTLLVLEGDSLTAVRFQRLVLATGSYDRLPPIRGNDLPGVVGLHAAEVYADAGALAPGLRIAAWGPPSRLSRVQRLAERHGLVIAWSDDKAPRAIHGRRRVEAVLGDHLTPCDLFVVATAQPAIELAIQAGATPRLTSEGLPILAIATLPAGIEVVGDAAAATSGVPDVPAADAAIACLCEDVRFGDLKKCVAQGFGSAETVKRRTGAMTGPCQGKLCAATTLTMLRSLGIPVTLPRPRPPARPVPLRELAADA